MNSTYEKYSDVVSFDPSKMNQLIQLGRDLNEDVVSQLLQVHFETSEEALKEIEQDFLNLNFNKMKSTAHKLKSSCGTLGLNKLHGFCHGLEAYLGANNAEPSIVKGFVDCIQFEYLETKKTIVPFNKLKVGA